MRSWMWVSVVAAVLLLAPPALGQCGMMGGSSGHSHGGESGSRADRAEKKQRDTIARLLSQERSRALLLEMALEHPAFMRALIGRLPEAPEWRALAVQALAVAPVASAAADTSGAPIRAAVQEEPVYACPMHPEVTARAPGTCPKCGMTLERVPGRGPR